MPDFDKIAVVIPSLNPDDKLLAVVEGLISRGFNDLIVVNDGSAPDKTRHFESVAALPGCTVLCHEVNRGKGRALKTAFSYILEHRPDCIGAVTVDGDNQHHPDDVAAMAAALMNNGGDPALLLGVRDFSQPEVPARSRFGNRLSALVFWLLCRQKISDTQTGLRGIPRQLLPGLTALSGERFDFETNMLLYLHKNRIPVNEIGIRTIYLEENASSHFHAIFDSLSILRLVLAFAFSSVVSAALDVGCYGLAVTLLHALPLRERVLVATVVARATSSVVNFWLNRRAVFGGDSALSHALPRYYLLCACQLFCSWAGVWGLTLIIGGSSMLAKIIIDALLFFISFNIQRRWVFSEQNK